MRPLQRGAPPQTFNNYTDAKPFLVSRLGMYCSYCERRIPTNLAVEHVQPKGNIQPTNLPKYAHLKNRWDNFLLGCGNCNSTKGSKDVVLADLLVPDRDNTFLAFVYGSDGAVKVEPNLSQTTTKQAQKLLRLVGLQKSGTVLTDENAQAVALDRVSQRRQEWGTAKTALCGLRESPCAAVRTAIVGQVKAGGFFSVWMTVFSGEPQMRQLFIDAFPGTSGDFDENTAPVSGTNPDNLPYGGKL